MLMWRQAVIQLFKRLPHYLTARNIKLALAALGLVLTVFMLLYMQVLIRELRRREQMMIDLYASAFKHYTMPSTQPGEDIRFFLEKIVPAVDFPVIITDAEGEPYKPYTEFTLNIDLSPYKTEAEQYRYLKELLKEMEQDHPPIVFRYPGHGVLMKIYYADSQLLRQLQVLPLVALVAVTLFILIGYWGFSYVRRNEQNRVWVGLAKEAAHQLGTPLSSLLAWAELAKMNVQNPEQLRQIIIEMEKDLQRMQKIVERFSKIGSIPERRAENLATLMHDVVEYYRYRIPHLGKQIEIVERYEPIVRPVNPELFQWVIENLLKNAVEAIDQVSGRIELSLEQKNGKAVIQIRDNGKGMSPAVRRSAFRPGFTTKKRGWGLGLPLCKRIIEEYHQGKIWIKETGVGKGTTFHIEL